MNERDMRMMYDGRNPYGSEGGYVTSSRGRGRGRGRGRRGDRGMDYAGADYAQNQMARGNMRHDYNYGDMGNMGRGNIVRRDYGEDMPRGDGHYMHGGRQGQYQPVEFMGYCNGYYGSPEDYGRCRDYGYDMRGGRRDYGYDYGYDYGDYGETLSEKEMEHWEKKLMSQLDEREKQMFSKESLMQKAKNMGKQMEGFGEKELCLTALMIYTDYKQTIGQNPDMALRLAYDWLSDKDVAVKGANKLATYYDCIVEGDME